MTRSSRILALVLALPLWATVLVVVGPDGVIPARADQVRSQVAGIAPSPGAVVAWGDNISGELGTGDGGVTATPVQTQGLDGGVSAIASWADHSLALSGGPAGLVQSWGANASGQLGDGTMADRATPAPVLGGAACPAGAPSSCVPIAAGGAHSLAIRGGTVLAWGSNNFGQVGDGTHVDRDRPTRVAGLTNVVGIAAGGAHSLALRADGTVWAWGSDTFGQLGNGQTTSGPNPTPTQVVNLRGVVAIAAGAADSVALRADGMVMVWGDNDFGQLGNGSSASVSNTPVPVTGLSNVTAVAAGAVFILALRSDGSVWSWGANRQGQLGVGSVGGRSRGKPVPTLLSGSVTAIAAGGAHGLALTTGHTVMAWGSNLFGEQGNGTTQGITDPPNGTPAPVSGLDDVLAIAAGGAHGLAIQGHRGAAPPPGVPLEPSPPPIVGSHIAGVSTAPPPTNVAVTPQGSTSFQNPTLAVDPSNPQHGAIAYQDVSSSFIPNCFLAVTSDGGATWTNEKLIGPGGVFPFPQSVTDPTKVFNSCGVPSLAFGPTGTLYYVFNGLASFGNPNVFITVSNDNGTTFSPPRQIDLDARPGSAPTGSDRDYLSNDGRAVAVDLDTGDVYVAFSRFAGRGPRAVAPIRVARCAAGQLQTAAPLTCQTTQATPDFTQPGRLAFQMTVAGDGRVILAYGNQVEQESNDGFAKTGDLRFEVVSSQDRASTWSAPSLAEEVPEVCPISFKCEPGNHFGFSVSLATGGPVPGAVFVATSATRDGDSLVVVSASVDNGRSWIRRQAVGDPANQQFSGELSARASEVDLGYYELAPNGAQNVLLTRSPTGIAWNQLPRTITNVPMNPSLFSGFAGGRLALATTPRGTDVAWVDSRRGTVQSPQSDILFANVP